MSTQRRVDVADLRAAGNQVGQENVLLNGVNSETSAGFATAQVGWVGSSAAALSTVTAHWQIVSQVHTRAVGKHGGRMHTSAQRFGDTEEHNAEAVADVGAAAPGTAC